MVISLLDGFPLEQVPPGIVSIAWVRNWTERWIEQPWFAAHDLVFASSERSKRLIEERSSQVPMLMPLATNPIASGAPIRIRAFNRTSSSRVTTGG